MSSWLQINPGNQTVAACLSQFAVLGSAAMILAGYASAWWLLVSFAVYMAMQLAITVGCHRLFTHRSFECHRAWHWIFAYLTTLTWQASTVSWVHVHYAHHMHSDTDQDPHISTWNFLFWKRYRPLTGKYSRIVACMARDPLHMFLHRFAVPVILVTGLILALVNPMLTLFGLIVPMGYYFITSGVHQIFSHYRQIPRNLPWVEVLFPMGEWNHADHHHAPSHWNFGRYDIGTYLIQWIKR